MKAREKLKNLGKRTLSFVMALSMCMSFVPDVPVFADENTDTEITTEVTSYTSTESSEDKAEPVTKSQTEEVKSTEKSRRSDLPICNNSQILSVFIVYKKLETVSFSQKFFLTTTSQIFSDSVYSQMEKPTLCYFSKKSWLHVKMWIRHSPKI